jgi:hypothetical protein
MFDQLRLPVVVLGLLFVASACGGTESTPEASDEEVGLGPSASDEVLDSTAQSLSFGALPPNTSDVQTLGSVAFDDCTFSVGSALKAPPFPPKYLVWLRVEPTSYAAECGTGYSVLGSSYAAPSVAIARHPESLQLVVSHTAKLSPSGSAHTQLKIVEPSYVSGEVVRSSVLAARSPSAEEPWLGNVLSGALEVSADGTLVVTGSKDGLMHANESAPGAPNYRATYAQFFSDPSLTPVPSAIETF